MAKHGGSHPGQDTVFSELPLRFCFAECDSDDSSGMKGSPAEELRATEGKTASLPPECVVSSLTIPFAFTVPVLRPLKNASFRKMIEKET